MDVSTSIQSRRRENQPLLEKPGLVRDARVKIWSSLRWIGAAFCLAMIIASWVTMAEKLQAIGRTYNKPFFQSYLIHSFYAVMYIVWKIWIIFPGQWSCNKIGEGALFKHFKVLAISTAIIALLSYLSAAFWYISLTRTSISANTAIYQSASIVVFIISVPLLGEKVSLLKILSVVFTVSGVSLVSVFDDRHKTNFNETNTASNVTSSPDLPSQDPIRSTPLGYMYVVLSMIFYAVLETGYKKFCTIPDDPAAVQNGVRVLGYVGVHTMLWMWPLLVVLHYSAVEPFELPPLHTFELLMVNVLLDLVFNGALFVCIALSSPLFTAVGSVLAIPSSVLVDWLINHYLLPWQAFVGIIILIGGFLMLVLCEYWEAKHHHHHHHGHGIEVSMISSSKNQADVQDDDMGLINSKVKKERKGILYYII